MKILDLEQRSEEWHRVRGVIPTASRFDKILTPTGAASKQAGTYMNELLGNWLAGGVTHEAGEGFTSDWMQRGIDMEDEAIAWYEMTVSEVERVGFCVRDDEQAGCSPDALLTGRQTGLELKCPKASTHVQYLLDQKLPTTYIPQVQGSMWVTGYSSWDFLSYHPDLEPLLIHVQRDDNYLVSLQLAIVGFNNKMQTKKMQLIEMGYNRAA